MIGIWRGSPRLAAEVPPSHSRSGNRQRHLLDAAQAHVALGQHSDAIDILAGLQTIASA